MGTIYSKEEMKKKTRENKANYMISFQETIVNNRHQSAPINIFKQVRISSTELPSPLFVQIDPKIELLNLVTEHLQLLQAMPYVL